MLNTQLAAAAGVIGACLLIYAKTKTLDVGMAGNGAIAGLVGITAGCGYVEYWAAPIIGFISGLIVVVGVLDRREVPGRSDRSAFLLTVWPESSAPRQSASSVRRDWCSTEQVPVSGTRIFGDQSFSSTFGQLGVRCSLRRSSSCSCSWCRTSIFAIIKATIGIRVSEEEEDAGLDISSHGMYGYPEAFIPQPEYPVGAYTPSMAGTPVAPLETTPPSDQA